MVAAGPPLPDNATLAANLREFADVLTQQQADGFRISAYRRAADVVAGLSQPVSEILKTSGREGLTALPGIGLGIAAALAEMATTGHWSQLERIRGAIEPEKLFQTIPGIGKELATRLHEHLHIETLEALAATMDALSSLKVSAAMRSWRLRRGSASLDAWMRTRWFGHPPERHALDRSTCTNCAKSMQVRRPRIILKTIKEGGSNGRS